MNSILFICTGNIFRSLVAEYALKAALGSAARIVVGSAGIQALPQPMHPLIFERLIIKGVDPSRHVQRRLTRELLEGTDLPVAMGLDHREFVRLQFDRDVLLFNEICYQLAEPILDVHEAIPDWHLREDVARTYAISLVDYIWDSMPAFLEGLQKLRAKAAKAGR